MNGAIPWFCTAYCRGRQLGDPGGFEPPLPGTVETVSHSNQRSTPPQSDLSVPKRLQICQLPQRWSQGHFVPAGG